nr:DUF6266 family protein [uncultured Flavobacterium sp.]
MATYEKGILGPFTGTVGTVVGANWRGKNVMRSRPKKTSRTPTELQLLQRDKFAAITRFLTPIRGLYNRYFGTNLGVRSRYNIATSYHIKEAITLVNDVFEITYNKVLISKGELQGVLDPTAVALANTQIKLTWADNSGQGMALPTDTLLVVIYSEDLNLFEVFEYQATREDAEVTLSVAAYFSSLEVHCWVSFVNDDRKLSASSNYLGTVTLT